MPWLFAWLHSTFSTTHTPTQPSQALSTVPSWHQEEWAADTSTIPPALPMSLCLHQWFPTGVLTPWPLLSQQESNSVLWVGAQHQGLWRWDWLQLPTPHCTVPRGSFPGKHCPQYGK